MLRKQLLDASRGRIVTLLQRGGSTVEEIAAGLSLTANAVRAQITAMERDGVVRKVGRRLGTTRPSQVFELTPEVEQRVEVSECCDRSARPQCCLKIRSGGLRAGRSPRRAD